jgi:glycosyltransferase involved in cell wall biosynthesis
MGGSVGVVMAVRNEESTIAATIEALARQTLPPAVVAVVDDGSTDSTKKVLESLGGLPFLVRVASLPYHRENHVGRPELARSLNSGLKLLGEFAPPIDYVMKLDGDHLLPTGYVETMVSKMASNPRLAVASGWILNEPHTSYAPRGSGMLVSAEFWRKANGMRFPETYGWESWTFLKAMQMGYETRNFKEVPTRISRKTSLTKGVLYGRGMYALGYDWVFALGRCLFYASHSPRAGLEMWRGYVDHRGVGKTDVSDWVGRNQRQTLLRRVSSIVLRRGRR